MCKKGKESAVTSSILMVYIDWIIPWNLFRLEHHGDAVIAGIIFELKKSIYILRIERQKYVSNPQN